MSGHSKWAQIKRSKGAKDAKRGVLFSKLSKKITMAAKAGGSSDPNLNFQLRSEWDSARSEGMPLENIERAAKKAFGTDAVSITEVVYEGYGPYGTAFIVEVATDSTNRAVQNIKHIFSKHSGTLGAMGSVAWQFQTKGQILIERTAEIDTIQMAAIEAGADDVKESAEGLEVYTQPEDLQTIRNILEKAGAKVAQVQIVKLSTQGINLAEDQREKVHALLAELEDYEDVLAVHTSMN
ncbi:MAG TPA: YebC/PmpR family DNA-binding transcriptional regulator [Patescibacteria group bacterium]|nr:YebC/PmpR family DNA-binding transcriptional regulator [Patescibacteria group bacterium]